MGFPPIGSGPDAGDSKIDKVNETLVDLTKLVQTFGPLVGSSILLGKMMVSLLRSQGEDVEVFEVEIARLERSLVNAQAAIDEFDAKYPKAPVVE